MTLPIRLTPRNNQEAYDIAVKHLLSMEHQSTQITDKGIPYCCYRTEDGNRCVIGSMITDEEYDPIIDDHNVQDSSNIEFLHMHQYVDIGSVELMLLIGLQQAHDERRNWGPGGFTNLGTLRTLARDYLVSSSILDALFEGLPSWSKESR